MKRIAMMMVLTGCASLSFAQIFDMGSNLEHRTLDLTGSQSVAIPTVVYSALPGPYSAFAARTGSLGIEDYTSTATSPFGLNSMQFVGGVTAVGGQLRFDFLDSSGSAVSSFTSTFGTAGNFVWTISGIAPLNITLPTSGRLRITALNGVTGQWFLASAAPTIGTNDPSFGGATGFNHRYQLEAVPEPATMTALGLGIAAMLRRRKAAKK